MSCTKRSPTIALCFRSFDPHEHACPGVINSPPPATTPHPKAKTLQGALPCRSVSGRGVHERCQTKRSACRVGLEHAVLALGVIQRAVRCQGLMACHLSVIDARNVALLGLGRLTRSLVGWISSQDASLDRCKMILRLDCGLMVPKYLAQAWVRYTYTSYVLPRPPPFLLNTKSISSLLQHLYRIVQCTFTRSQQILLFKSIHNTTINLQLIPDIIDQVPSQLLSSIVWQMEDHLCPRKEFPHAPCLACISRSQMSEPARPRSNRCHNRMNTIATDKSHNPSHRPQVPSKTTAREDLSVKPPHYRTKSHQNSLPQQPRTFDFTGNSVSTPVPHPCETCPFYAKLVKRYTAVAPWSRPINSRRSLPT